MFLNRILFIWIAPGLLSTAAWIVLFLLEKNGDIEGPHVYVNGTLWMSLFFSIALSITLSTKILKNPFSLPIKIIIAALIFALSTVLLTTFLFMISPPILTLLDKIYY